MTGPHWKDWDGLDKVSDGIRSVQEQLLLTCTLTKSKASLESETLLNMSEEKKPWIMNAFAMAAPGHLAPGKHINVCERK